VASAGPYASLHPAPDRQPHQHPTTQFFTGRMPFLPPNQEGQNLCKIIDDHNLIINETQVQTEKKKGKYGIKYSLAAASDGPCLHGWGLTLKIEFPHSRFSTLTTGGQHTKSSNGV